MEIITANEKKSFIRWFLEHYQLKKRECVWILNYVREHDALIEKIHFVDYAQYAPRALIMSTHCSDKAPFRYYKDNIMTTDAERAFHDIRLNRSDDLYIQLNFGDKNVSTKWISVLEENHYIPNHLQENEEDKKFVETLTSQFEMDFLINNLMKKIDETLIQGDKETFLLLSQKLIELKKHK